MYHIFHVGKRIFPKKRRKCIGYKRKHSEGGGGIGMRSLRKWIEQAETAHMGAYVDHEVCEGEGEGVRESSP